MATYTKGLTNRQRNILRLRKELNMKKKDTLIVFTKYKILTYVLVFLFPPYAMYRIWKQDSPFVITEKVGQTMVCIIYVCTLLQAFL